MAARFGKERSSLSSAPSERVAGTVVALAGDAGSCGELTCGGDTGGGLSRSTGVGLSWPLWLLPWPPAIVPLSAGGRGGRVPAPLCDGPGGEGIQSLLVLARLAPRSLWKELNEPNGSSSSSGGGGGGGGWAKPKSPKLGVLGESAGAGSGLLLPVSRPNPSRSPRIAGPREAGGGGGGSVTAALERAGAEVEEEGESRPVVGCERSASGRLGCPRPESEAAELSGSLCTCCGDGSCTARDETLADGTAAWASWLSAWERVTAPAPPGCRSATVACECAGAAGGVRAARAGAGAGAAAREAAGGGAAGSSSSVRSMSTGAAITSSVIVQKEEGNHPSFPLSRPAHQPPSSRDSTISIRSSTLNERYLLSAPPEALDHTCCATAQRFGALTSLSRPAIGANNSRLCGSLFKYHSIKGMSLIACR